MILFPPAKYDFNNSVYLNVFVSKAATSAVVVEHCSHDLESFIDSAFRQTRNQLGTLDRAKCCLGGAPIF